MWGISLLKKATELLPLELRKEAIIECDSACVWEILFAMFVMQFVMQLFSYLNVTFNWAY